MKISASSILDLNEDFKIHPKDTLQILGFQQKNNSEIVELLHLASGNRFYKDISEINFLIEKENYEQSQIDHRSDPQNNFQRSVESEQY